MSPFRTVVGLHLTPPDSSANRVPEGPGSVELLLRLRRYGDRYCRGVWVVLDVRPHTPAPVTSVVVDDGVLAGISQQASWFVAFRTAANRHGGSVIVYLLSTASA